MNRRILGSFVAAVAVGILLIGSFGTASAQMAGGGSGGMMGGKSSGGYSGYGMMGGAPVGQPSGGMMSGTGASGTAMTLGDARAAMLQYMADQGLDYMNLSGMYRNDNGFFGMMVDPESGAPLSGLMLDSNGNMSQVGLDMMTQLGYQGMMSGW